MDYSWFRDLAHLARTGNFSQAAEMGNVSQPAFSRRIKAIENWVGVPLVDRSKHPVSLTSAGSQMLEAGEQALARIESERNQIREARSFPDQYVVKFGAQHSIGWRFFPAWLQTFENTFGPIISRLRADDLPNCLKDLAEGEVDFVIAYTSRYVPNVGINDDFDSVIIGHDTLIPVCKCRSNGRPLFGLRGGNTGAIPYLRFGDNAPINGHIEPLLAEHDLNRRLDVSYENSMAGALRIRAREGAGVAWLPKTLVAPDLDAGLMVQASDSDLQIRLEIRLHRLSQHSNGLTRRIWSFLSVRQSVPLLSKL